MANLNKIMLIGRVGSEPEVRNFENGNKIANLSLAVTENYKDKNGQYVDNATWFRLRFFGHAADTVEKHLHKGDSIYVEGPMVQRDYTNKDGQKVVSWEVKVMNFQFLTKKGVSESRSTQGVDNDMPYFE